MTEPRRKHIFISEREHGLPYSKGLTASSLMATGLPPMRAYAVANKVEQELFALGRDRVSREQLRELTLRVLRSEESDEVAQAFIKWQSVGELDVPLIVLLGGSTGVGKSTIATQLAYRLGITRVVSTDAVREVLRSALTEEMFPTLYSSSFESDKAVRQPIPHSGDKLIIGFREQAQAVAVGAQRLIDRAITEGTDMILEGAHLVPGFLESVESDQAVIVPLLITIEDEDLHKSHFYSRGRDASARPQDRYLQAFKKIRRIQKYMTNSALMRGVPIIQHYDLDATLSQVIDHVIEKALDSAEKGTQLRGSDPQLLERAGEAVGRTKASNGTHEKASADGAKKTKKGEEAREVVP